MACCKSGHNCTLEFINFLRARRSDLQAKLNNSTDRYGCTIYKNFIVNPVAAESHVHEAGSGELCEICYSVLATQKAKDKAEAEVAELKKKIDMITTLLGDEGY